MALENLTLFELHLENARFDAGLGRGAEEDADDASAPEDAEGPGGGGRRVGLPLGALLLVAAVAAVALRRRRGGAEPSDDEGDGEQITIEHATEQ